VPMSRPTIMGCSLFIDVVLVVVLSKSFYFLVIPSISILGYFRRHNGFWFFFWWLRLSSLYRFFLFFLFLNRFGIFLFNGFGYRRRLRRVWIGRFVFCFHGNCFRFFYKC